jgi:hypothetical protein
MLLEDVFAGTAHFYAAAFDASRMSLPILSYRSMNSHWRMLGGGKRSEMNLETSSIEFAITRCHAGVF